MTASNSYIRPIEFSLQDNNRPAKCEFLLSTVCIVTVSVHAGVCIVSVCVCAERGGGGREGGGLHYLCRAPPVRVLLLLIAVVT